MLNPLTCWKSLYVYIDVGLYTLHHQMLDKGVVTRQYSPVLSPVVIKTEVATSSHLPVASEDVSRLHPVVAA